MILVLIKGKLPSLHAKTVSLPVISLLTFQEPEPLLSVFLFQFLAIHIKSGEQHIVIGHNYRKARITSPSPRSQCLFHHLPGQPRIVSTRTHKEQILLLIPLQNQLPNKLLYNHGRRPRIDRKDKTDLLILPQRELPCVILPCVRDKNKSSCCSLES